MTRSTLSRALGVLLLAALAWPARPATAQSPPRAQLAPMLGATAAQPGREMRAALVVSLREGLHVNANQPRDPSLIPVVLTVMPPAGVTVDEIAYPVPTDLAQEGSDVPLAVYEREFAIGVRLTLDPGTTAESVVVPGSLRYQACDERVCYIPGTVAFEWVVPVAKGGAVTPQNEGIFAAIPFGTGQAPPATATTSPGAGAPVLPSPEDAATLGGLDAFSQQASTGGYLGSEAFLTFIRNAEAGVVEPGLLDGKGIWAILLIVLVGGLALNLTPCVLPMIPINLAVIGAGARAGSRRRGLWLGAAYGGAMALVYGVLGAVVITTAGTFGTINASPWFNAGIAVVFVALGLAMFDVWSLDFSRFASGVGTSSGARGSYALAFGMGAVAALLAGACVAPVVIQVVLFSSNLYASGTTLALALPFVLGVGMALPWPIAGAGISAFPPPGAWMVRVKQAFGVVILATAAYYGYEGYRLAADRWVDAGEVSASVEEKLKEGWYSSLDEGLAAAQRDGKPVLIDMWATWCKNCLVMDRTTFRDPVVASALDGYVKVKVQAEAPDEAPARDLMQRFGAVGLPTYVILRPKP